MENEITAHRAGTISELSVAEGTAVNAGDQIAKIE
jgi:biotin carboxyl carrier protein